MTEEKKVVNDEYEEVEGDEGDEGDEEEADAQAKADEDLIASIISNVNATSGTVVPRKPLLELNPQVVAEMKDVFSLFDFKNDGTIATEDLGTVLRGLGKNLTEEQISDFINENDHDGSGKLDFSCFYRIFSENEPMPEASTLEEVEEFFEPFDLYRDGKMMAEDFVHMLKGMGEPLTTEDVNHLLREIEIDGDNRIDYRDFVRHMFETSAL